MQVDRYTKTALTVIAVCLVLLTLKEYEIVSDAEAQVRSGQFQPNDSSANQVMDVNIVSINGESFDQRTPALPVNVRFFRGLKIPTFNSSPGGLTFSLPVQIRDDSNGYYYPKVTHGGRLRTSK
jgi:hypothetical protein